MRFAAVLSACLVLTATASEGATFEELAARAAAALAAEKTGEALDLYRQALQLKSNWEEGWWFVGIISYNSGQFADGEKALSRLIEVNPKSAAGWAFLGLCEYETGAYDLSLDHIERGLSMSGGGPADVQQVLRFHEALLHTRQRRWDAGRRIFRGLVQRGLQDPALIAGIGVNSLERPMLPSEVPPEEQDLVLRAGNATYRWMSGDTATDATFQSLIERYPATPGVHYLYATYLLSSNQQNAGTAELKRELELNPGNASAHGTMALVLVLADKAAEALVHAEKAANSPKPDARTLYVYGLALSKTADIHKAIDRLEAAEKLDGENLDIHIVLAGAYSQAGRSEDARRERRISIDMARGDAHP